MEYVPDEIVAQIVWYIHPLYGDLLTLRTVCHKWRRVIDTTGALWKHLHMDDNFVSAQVETIKSTLKICLQRYGNFVQCIRTEEQDFFSCDELRAILQSLPSLRKLNVSELVWTHDVLNKFASAALLRQLTLNVILSEHDEARMPLCTTDIRELGQHFPNLEVLSLQIHLEKLLRVDFVRTLDDLKPLKELQLDICPKGEMEQVPTLGVRPLREIVASKHAEILTSLEIRCIPITVDDMITFTKGLKRLEHLTIGAVSSSGDPTMETLILESQSLKVLFLSSMPNPWIQKLRCNMNGLELLVLSECYDVRDIDVRAERLLSLVLRENISLVNIKTSSQRLNELEIRNSGLFEYESFKKLLKEHPRISRLELEVEWESVVLGHHDCAELRKIVFWEADLATTRLQVNCPRLQVFKCSGSLHPRKVLRDLKIQGCAIEISALHLRKLKVQDLIHAKEINVRCDFIDEVHVLGTTFVQRPLSLSLVATDKICHITLSHLRLNQVSVCSPLVCNVMLQNCCLATESDKCRMRFKCDSVQALRVLECDRIRRFALKVPYVGFLTLNSCKRLNDLDLGNTRVSHIRVAHCPLLSM